MEAFKTSIIKLKGFRICISHFMVSLTSLDRLYFYSVTRFLWICSYGHQQRLQAANAIAAYPAKPENAKRTQAFACMNCYNYMGLEIVACARFLGLT